MLLFVDWENLDYLVITCLRMCLFSFEMKIGGDCSFEIVWIEDSVECRTFVRFLAWLKSRVEICENWLVFQPTGAESSPNRPPRPGHTG